MIAGIIQARMSSTRLPNKTLMDIGGKPLLWHLLERVKRSNYIDQIVIATTWNPRDRQIIEFAKKYGLKVFQGKEHDVLDRFYQVAKTIKADTIVRVTPDSPFLCPKVVDKVIREYLNGSCDYATNTMVYTYPDGYDVEVFSFEALQKAWRECKDPVGREHVTPYIRNSGRFKIVNTVNETPVDPREYKWSVDTKEDLKFAREVYKHLHKNGKSFSMKEVFNLMKKHPEIKRINTGTIVNEGYYKSLLKLKKVKPKRLKFRNSFLLKKKAEKLIPACSQTFSKSPFQFVQGAAPVFLEKGKGSHVWDVDGNEYIDYAMALGPIILGYDNPAVHDSVKKILGKGVIFTLPHRLEVELAEILCEMIPCAEMVRFGKNGSDATSGAVRVARAYTGRDIIVCCGYHGWQDWYIATTTRSRGIPDAVKKLTLTFEYNNIESLKRIFSDHKNQVAAVIMEPLGVVEPEDNFLGQVKELAHRNGALLIFDEIVSGFRFALGGAQEYFQVIPDLACFGKAMANGFPLSAIVGKKEIMKLFEDVFYSFTAGGEIVALTAAMATIQELKNKDVIKFLWEQGRKIQDGYNVLAREYQLSHCTRCLGLPPRTVIEFKDKNGEEDMILKSLFQQECIKRGILFTAAHNISFAHSHADIDYTLKVYRTVLEIVSSAKKKNNVKGLLKGKPIMPVFRKY